MKLREGKGRSLPRSILLEIYQLIRVLYQFGKKESCDVVKLLMVKATQIQFSPMSKLAWLGNVSLYLRYFSSF